jgi:hypothetical protein
MAWSGLLLDGMARGNRSPEELPVPNAPARKMPVRKALSLPQSDEKK